MHHPIYWQMVSCGFETRCMVDVRVNLDHGASVDCDPGQGSSEPHLPSASAAVAHYTTCQDPASGAVEAPHLPCAWTTEQTSSRLEPCLEFFHSVDGGPMRKSWLIFRGASRDTVVLRKLEVRLLAALFIFQQPSSLAPSNQRHEERIQLQPPVPKPILPIFGVFSL